MTLKELRMWHWRECLRHRKQERWNEEASERSSISPQGKNLMLNSAASRKLKADLHLSAVLALNNICVGTAEDDCAEADRIAKGWPREYPPGTYLATVRDVIITDAGNVRVEVNIGEPIPKPVFTSQCLAAMCTYYNNFPEGDGLGHYARGIRTRFFIENINACNRHLGKPDWK
jgi:hypothetical protein